MASGQSLREFISKRLSAAAEEIFSEFEETIIQYEKEIARQRRLLELSWNPQINLHRIELPLHYIRKEEEILTDQQLWSQERSSSLDLEGPEPLQEGLEPPQIKVEQDEPELLQILEQDELSISQDEDQLVLKQEMVTSLVTPEEERDHDDPEPISNQLLFSGFPEAETGATAPQASTDMEVECIDEIQRVLPELDHERLLAITEHLSSVVGVTKKDDLAFLEKADFQEYLTPIQCRKLLQAFKQRELKDKVDTEVSSVPSGNVIPLQTLSYNPGSTLLKTQNSWISQFQIPWEKMPASLSQTMLRGQRASPADRRAMVRTVVSTMQQHCSNPNRAACTEIAKTIVAKYPLTFADMNEEGEQIGIGYYSLINQLKTRVEHVNRNNTSDRIRRPRTTQSSNADATIKTSRCKLDSYGCVNWQPTCLPDGETADSLEERRKQMAAIFQSVGPRAADSPDIDFSMDLTYIYQRHMINTCPPPSVCEIEEQWPFLFTKRGLCNHFKILTGIDICDRLGEALQTKGKKIVHFFRSHSHNKDTQHILQDLDRNTTMQRSCHGIAAMLLLMKCFGEKEESVFILADTTSTKASVERERALPPSPRLLMLGNTYLEATKWMVSIEGKVAYILDEDLGFADALSVLMASFYAFNLEYQEPACATLEFIQRFFLRINPEDGSKCTARTGVSRKTGQLVKRKSATMNSRVLSFLRQLTEFEWKNMK